MALKFTEWHYCKKCPEIYIHCFEGHNGNFNVRERGIFGLLRYKGHVHGTQTGFHPFTWHRVTDGVKNQANGSLGDRTASIGSSGGQLENGW